MWMILTLNTLLFTTIKKYVYCNRGVRIGAIKNVKLTSDTLTNNNPTIAY